MAAKKGVTQFCDKCNQQIGTYGFNRHYKVCNGIKKVKSASRPSGIERTHPIPPTPCKFCQKLHCSLSSLKNHECRCKENPERQLPIITPAGRERMRQSTLGKHLTTEQKQHLSEVR